MNSAEFELTYGPQRPRLNALALKVINLMMKENASPEDGLIALQIVILAQLQIPTESVRVMVRQHILDPIQHALKKGAPDPKSTIWKR